MIVTRDEMHQIEINSNLTSIQLIQRATDKLAKHINQHLNPSDKVLLLAGKGNNGADCIAMLPKLNANIVGIIFVDGKPTSPQAIELYNQLDTNYFQPISQLETCLHECDIIIDGIYGIGYHGSLKDVLKPIFKQIQSVHKPIFSIDINSAAECDSCQHDPYALQSTITFAIDCYKPFHMLYKNHSLFQQLELVSLDIPHNIPIKSLDMNTTVFFKHLEKRKVNSHKTSYGKILLIGGSYGMAGALSLNITGAKSLGFPYIEVGVNDSIYPIVASKYTNAVFHPFSKDTINPQLLPSIKNANVIGFGSGTTNMHEKEDVLDILIQESQCPLVFDAEAIRLLKYNTWKLHFAKSKIIITPHIGEFADLFHLEIKEVKNNPLAYALKYAKELNIYIVLKDAHTIIATPSGHFYINQTGNQALAQAGSGDLLTGMITALLAYQTDIPIALCMAVWLHGYIADRLIQNHSSFHLNLEDYPSMVDQYFYENGY